MKSQIVTAIILFTSIVTVSADQPKLSPEVLKKHMTLFNPGGPLHIADKSLPNTYTDPEEMLRALYGFLNSPQEVVGLADPEKYPSINVLSIEPLRKLHDQLISGTYKAYVESMRPEEETSTNIDKPETATSIEIKGFSGELQEDGNYRAYFRMFNTRPIPEGVKVYDFQRDAKKHGRAVVATLSKRENGTWVIVSLKEENPTFPDNSRFDLYSESELEEAKAKKGRSPLYFTSIYNLP